MAKYFGMIVSGDGFESPITDEQLLDAAEALGNSGCTDCSVMAHRAGQHPRH
jgi:hypothetical protein